MKQWKIAVIGLLAFCAAGVALAAGEANCPGEKVMATAYEISLNAPVTGDAIQALKDALEKREAFTAGKCEKRELPVGARFHLAYVCEKSDFKTDQLFKDIIASQPQQTLSLGTRSFALSSTCTLAYCCGVTQAELCKKINRTQPCTVCPTYF